MSVSNTFHLVGGAVRCLFTNEVNTNSDYDVVVVGLTYKEVLVYLLNQSNVQIFVPESRYIQAILFDFIDRVDKSNSNWNAISSGVIKCKVDGKYKVDYALARKESDSNYNTNSVVPSNVVIDSNVTLLEDLSRRDFTMNAMTLQLSNPLDLFSYNIKDLYDPFNGRDAIYKRIINTVGRPIDRFVADPTRVLRLIKFMLRLDFDASMQIKMNLDDGLYKDQVNTLVESYRLKINDDRTVNELKSIFNSKHSVYKAIGIMYRLLPKSLFDVIFNDNVYLQPTIIHNK